MSNIESGFDHTPSGFRFQWIASVVLGTITGLLIALPISQGESVFSGPIVLLASGMAGALIGYRRKDSRAFLYLCFATILLLAGTFTNAIQPQ
ncbi:MAG: hypothetical protein KDD70_00655 [Bdellovibrionales bacterium]|nr:hypothetical protein [Bdellovibrionales bacterium]